jgi:hypothetical protein
VVGGQLRLEAVGVDVALDDEPHAAEERQRGHAGDDDDGHVLLGALDEPADRAERAGLDRVAVQVALDVLGQVERVW